jgi:nucleotide-binding universal stress UspA family protein
MQCIPTPYSANVQRVSTIMGSDGRKTFAKIMVAVDGSPNSMKAFDHALRLVEELQTELIIIHVISDPRTGLLVEYGTRHGSMAVVHAYVEAAKKEAIQWLKPLEARAKQNGINTKTEILWKAGKSPVSMITEYAKKHSIDLIVIGTRGLGGFKRLLMGSVASGIVSHSSCSVMVVR